MENKNTVLETTAIKGLAAASVTPFKTAFKLTLGIMAAQFLIGLVFGAIVLVGIVTTGLLFK